MESNAAQVAEGNSDTWQERQFIVKERAVPSTGAIGFWKIALAVLVGNLLTGFVVAIVYSGMK